MVTRYSICALPLDNIDAFHFTITVEWRGEDRWAVCHAGSCATKGGVWSHERQPSSRTDRWKKSHRFDRETALALAEKLAPKITLMGMTAQDVLDKQAAWLDEH